MITTGSAAYLLVSQRRYTTMTLGHQRQNARVSALSLRAQRRRILARHHNSLAGLSKTDEPSLS